MLLVGLILLTKAVCAAVDQPDYGQFGVDIMDATECRGPRLKNCTIYKVENTPGSPVVIFNYDVLQDVSPNMAKVTAENQQNPSPPLIKMQMRKPCEHIFIRPIFETLFNASSSCVVKKGVYTGHINMVSKVKEYFGSKFFYGNFTFKTLLTSKTCNFSCVKISFSIHPLS